MLGGLGKALFGSPGESAPTTVAGFQQPFLQDLFQRAQEFSQQPGISPLEQQAQQQALSFAGGLNPFLQGAQGAGQFLTSTDILSPESNPFLAQTAQAATRPIFQQLTEDVLPAIRGGAVGAGGYGGSRQGIAEGIASRGALQAAGDVSGDIFSRGYGQGLGALQQGLSLAPQTAALGLLPSQIMAGVGEQQRLAPFEQLSRFQSLLGAPIMQGGGGTTAQPGLASQFGLGFNIG
jgi:hypothetical protein